MLISLAAAKKDPNNHIPEDTMSRVPNDCPSTEEMITFSSLLRSFKLISDPIMYAIIPNATSVKKGDQDSVVKLRLFPRMPGEKIAPIKI